MSNLPEQNVLPSSFVKRQRRTAERQADMDAVAAHARRLELLEGGQDEDVVEGRPPPPPQRVSFRVFTNVKESREDYLARAKAVSLMDNNIDEYFTEPNLHYSFGVQAEHLMRLGFDEMNKVWKVYLKRKNISYVPGEKSRPSILGFLLTEMDSTVEFLENVLSKIEEGLANKKPYLKPDSLVGWKLEQPRDNIGFWTTDDTWYSDSGNCRIRVMWQYGNVYMIHFNQVQEPTQKYPFNFGPKVRLSRKEVMDFVKNYKDIIEQSGPAIGIN